MLGEVVAGVILALGITFLTYELLCRKRDNNMEEKQPKFEIFLDKKKKHRFRLIAPNGEIICQSEGYESKQACRDTIGVLPEYALKAKIFDLS
jgi:uncharacterized protein YegP (UPF0339 family)